jgi:hypothetical protein
MKQKLIEKESGHTVLFGVLIVAVLAAVGFAAVRIHNHNKVSVANTSSTVSAGSPTSSNSENAVSAPLPSGTDNSSLQGDLSNVNSSLGQQASDQNAASTAVNDQQSEISVPTN